MIALVHLAALATASAAASSVHFLSRWLADAIIASSAWNPGSESANAAFGVDALGWATAAIAFVAAYEAVISHFRKEEPSDINRRYVVDRRSS